MYLPKSPSDVITIGNKFGAVNDVNLSSNVDISFNVKSKLHSAFEKVLVIFTCF